MSRYFTSANQPLGHTPLIRFDRLFPGEGAEVFAKLEQFNMAGSAKDRTATALIQQALEDGIIHRGSTLVESSSGNLGIAMARQAALHGMNFHCVVDPRVNASSVAIMRAFGAEVEMVTQPDPVNGDWLSARRRRVSELLEEKSDAVNLDQYSNEAAFAAHSDGTMAEIIEDLDGPPTHVIVAMSTTGTIGGCRKKLKELGLDTQVIGVDAQGSVLYDGVRGHRHLPGYGAGVVPALSASHTPDRIIRITDIDAVVGARKAARTEGYLPGASGGAVIAAALQLVGEVAQKARVALVLHDGGAGYSNTIYSDSWVEDELGVGAEELENRVREMGASGISPREMGL